MELAGAHRVLCISIVMLLVKLSLVGAGTLELSTTALASSGDNVTISWNNLESPTALDWLGIYTPPESPDQHYIGYIILSSVSGWETGKGSYAFPAVNMRAPYEFRLFRGYPPTEDTDLDEDLMPIPSIRTRLTVSQVVGFSSYNEPTQVHLSLTSNPSEMAVMYVTKDAMETYVRYGKESDNLVLIGIASAKTYQQKDMCHAPANSSLGWRDPGYMHLAKMTKLEPGVRYFYQVGRTETGWSKTFSFVSSYVDGVVTDALLFGDMGTYAPYRTFNWMQYESLNTIKWLQRDLDQLGNRSTLISHIGDISYARGYSWLWDNFFQEVEPVAARAPWHVCIGNHEYDWPTQPWKPDWAPYGKDSGGECGVPYSMRFAMPGTSSLRVRTDIPGVPETKNLYYSLNFGVVHFVWISTETDFTPGSDQYNWIAEDLKNTDRQKTPFIVFQGHRPMYSSDMKATRLLITRKLIEYLEPLLVQHKVSLALWGHVHKYERTCSLQNRTCMDAEKGVYPVHMVIGMGGQDWQPVDQPRPERPLTPIYPQPAWSLYRSFQFGYIRIHATKTLMTVSYVGNHDGQVHDEVKFSSPVATSVQSHNTPDLELVRLQEVPHVSVSKFSGFSNSHFLVGNQLCGMLIMHVAIEFVLGAAVTGVVVTLYSRRAAEFRVQSSKISSQTK